MPDPIIRTARDEDKVALGRMAAALVYLHHDFDPQRFFVGDGDESKLREGYGGWLVRMAKSDRAVVLVAEVAGSVVGYVCGTMEDRDWMALRDACGVLQDIYVEHAERRRGVARALVTELTTAMRSRGAPRVVLSTAAKNSGAQAFFASMGFRPTMIEMTRELGGQGS